MDQNKTGQFISQLRKEQGLTQKQLAEKLQLTDKAVSKWECGKSMPDHSIMVNLCDILGITVNELLSGEKLSSNEYNLKAEENIMTLMKEKNNNERIQMKQSILGLLALIILLSFLILVLNRAIGEQLRFSSFLDLIGIHIDICLTLLMLIAAKKLKAFLSIFKLMIHKTDDEHKIRQAKNAADFAIKAVLLAGGIDSVVWLVNWLSNPDNMGYFGPNLANMMLGLFYSFILSALLLIAKERI